MVNLLYCILSNGFDLATCIVTLLLLLLILLWEVTAERPVFLNF